MQAVRSRDTALEVGLRKLLWREGLRYRLQSRVFGRPDVVFPRLGVAVFLDGCFWHGCPKCYTAPVTNADFWRRKLVANRRRDRLVTRRLSREGWVVLRFWSHELRRDSQSVVRAIAKTVQHREARRDRAGARAGPGAGDVPRVST